jgi:flagellar biosynthetic protein FliP
MIAAMMVGMMILGVAVGTLGEPPGYSILLVEYALMGASMSVSMVAWMRFRRHTWSDGLEMSVAMLVPMFAVVIPFGLGAAGEAPGQSDHALMMLAHVAMVGGMVAVMIYRRDRYT